MFRLLFLYILTLISITACYSQNLVPNGSFELFTTCPNGSAQLSYTGNWAFAGASTDYYNACDTTYAASVPLNPRGFQYASYGNAYVGMVVLALDEVLDTGNYYYREPAGAFLTMPMTIGLKYFVSFKAALTLNDFEACCATNKLGVLFSTVQYSNANPAPINNFAHVYTDVVITDSLNWTTVSGSFIADSAYSFISVGNFFDTLNTVVIDYYHNYPLTSAAYYYIDDVKVSTDSLFAIGEEIVNAPITINAFPNPSNGYVHIQSAESQLMSIELYDLSGRIVYQAKNILPCMIDFNFLESGMYALSIKNEHYHFSTKLLINK